MQASLVASAFSATSFEAFIEAAAAAGVRSVEVPVGEAGLVPLDSSQAACTAWGQLAASRNISISAIAFEHPHETDFGIADDAQRKAAQDRVVAALDRAQWLGTDLVVLSPGIVTGDAVSMDQPEAVIRYEDVHTRSLETLLALRFEAGLRGVRIACRCGENGFLLSPIEVRAFLDRLNSPWVLASIDIDNIHRIGSPADWALTLARRLGHLSVRLPDDSAAARRELGGGSAIHQALRDIRYSGVLTYAGSGEASELATRIGELLQFNREDAESE